MNTLTIAIERYERFMPFYDGTVRPPPGVALRVKQVGATTPLRDGFERNKRMLIDGTFDVCEFGLSAYLMARDRGLAISAIPYFPRRLFSQSQIFVHADSPITHPGQLVGRRVAINSFQTSLSVLALGDLKFDYGAPWEEIIWCPTNSQILDFPAQRKPRVDPRCRGRRQALGEMLETGEIDAFLLPRPPRSVATGKVKARRLFADPKIAEREYFRRHGYFPIMHLIALRDDLVDRDPSLVEMIMAMFVEADGLSKDYHCDPNWSRLAWGRHYADQETAAFGGDPWPVGLEGNRCNLEDFAGYALDLGLIAHRPDIPTLFAEPVRGT
jgi:4,5-dihydroxyphthalate decarboxylase